jgi:hypothetical protein
VHFREILSGYFLFSRFDWSIFVKQLVAKHMKEIIVIKCMVFFSDIINIKKNKTHYIQVLNTKVFFCHLFPFDQIMLKRNFAKIIFCAFIRKAPPAPTLFLLKPEAQ